MGAETGWRDNVFDNGFNEQGREQSVGQGRGRVCDEEEEGKGDEINEEEEEDEEDDEEERG